MQSDSSFHNAMANGVKKLSDEIASCATKETGSWSGAFKVVATVLRTEEQYHRDRAKPSMMVCLVGVLDEKLQLVRVTTYSQPSWDLHRIDSQTMVLLYQTEAEDYATGASYIWKKVYPLLFPHLVKLFPPPDPRTYGASE